MKLCTTITIGLFCILLVGCSETIEQGQDRHLINTELINSYNDIAIQNAIIAQHTLFPYHFITNSAELNELGQRDFAVLTRHFIKHPGPLNIRRDDCSTELYQARINFILEQMEKAGLDRKQIHISDDLPAGKAMPSERIITILEKERETTFKSRVE